MAMVHVSLIVYLKTGQLGPFTPLSPRSCVREILGPPPNWDGWGGIAYEQSTIWIYDSIQFNFDDNFRIVDTHIGFDCKFENESVTYSDWTNPFVQLDDLEIDAICTPDLFVEVMDQHAILTTRKAIAGGRLMINTEAGVQARFGAITDFDASMESETRVRTDCTYLHRITTVKLA
jgi:hypothetical protein